MSRGDFQLVSAFVMLIGIPKSFLYKVRKFNQFDQLFDQPPANQHRCNRFR